MNNNKLKYNTKFLNPNASKWLVELLEKSCVKTNNGIITTNLKDVIDYLVDTQNNNKGGK